MKRLHYFFLATALLITTLSCQSFRQEAATETVAAPASPAVPLADYWHQGQAELNRYQLEQNRYGGLHAGEVVLVFVKEDFLTDLQVKNDRYRNPNSTPVLKTNQLRRFTTGIYDYSIMTSVFTPVRTDTLPRTLKVTMSSQEWCGQVWTQLNLQGNQYRSQLRSYFEGEGDREEMLPAVLLEDEIFNRIRLDYRSLPVGLQSVIPAQFYARLMHRPQQAEQAELSLNDYRGDVFSGQDLKEYTVYYPGLDRRLQIVFSARAPYLIEGWTDTYPSAFDRQARTTTARRQATILDDYWNHNSPADTLRRQPLGLSFFGK